MKTAFSMFDVMAILAVLIASLGIVNTLTMNIIERTQEIGMLRAIGMTRSQVVEWCFQNPELWDCLVE